ncbi:hypothetical protein GCM10023225_18340 [Kineococcus glutinatus]|uniref:2-C-methyl-D-erythritol 4-phosphate cytidylyltransferase n=1 Tax=Kineococcus glutinatus TaxID=1070872 RepID=A0ABP9HTU6_9ACTN
MHALSRAAGVDVVVVACPPGSSARVTSLLAPVAGRCEVHVVEGAPDRQGSVRAALDRVPGDVDVVLVHDAARCLTPPAVFADVVRAVRAGARAVVPALPVTDTIKQVRGGVVVGTPDRRELWAVQTPQGFDAALLRAVHADPPAGLAVTDDAGMVEAAGHEVLVVPGSEHAFKITRPIDLLLAEAVLAGHAPERAEEAP